MARRKTLRDWPDQPIADCPSCQKPRVPIAWCPDCGISTHLDYVRLREECERLRAVVVAASNHPCIYDPSSCLGLDFNGPGACYSCQARAILREKRAE